MKNINFYIVCPNRRVHIDVNTTAKARAIAREKFPDALKIERETVKKDINRKYYLI